MAECLATSCGFSNGTCAEFVPHFFCDDLDTLGCDCGGCCVYAPHPPPIPSPSTPPNRPPLPTSTTASYSSAATNVVLAFNILTSVGLVVSAFYSLPTNPRELKRRVGREAWATIEDMLRDFWLPRW